MRQPSQQIAERYQVELTDQWRLWFDHDADSVSLAGAFREASQTEALLDRKPATVWPGLMLPDTLPLIGNQYGDWICVRVDKDNRFGELLHWYHGGGDWIPVGQSVAEAVLHDVVDQFRPSAGQVLRGASESIAPDHLAEVIQRLNCEGLRSWLTNSLTPSAESPAALQRVFEALSKHDYMAALGLMYGAGWSIDATLCDQIENALQLPISALADDAIAKQLGMNWEPEYVRWLFDTQQIPNEALHQIQAILRAQGHPATSPDSQNWIAAERLAREVLARRNDLAWAVDIAGWAAQRRGDVASACETYFAGRLASAFSNQSVRLRSHWFESQFGKVSLAELWNLREHLDASQRDNAYVQKVWQTPARLLQREVQDFWMQSGRSAMREGNFAEAYECFYRAGWDLGAQRMTDYLDILGKLIESAEAAGWRARAAVAATHLACLA